MIKKMVYNREDLEKYLALGYVLKEEIYPDFSYNRYYVMTKKFLIKHCEPCRTQWYEINAALILWVNLNFCPHCGHQLKIFLESE